MRAPLRLLLITAALSAVACLQFPANGRYKCDPKTGADCDAGTSDPNEGRDGGTTNGPLAVTTSSLPDAYGGEPYAAALAASGVQGQATWTLQSGTLPAGLGLDPSGAIGGTPDPAGAEGSFSLGVKVRDGSGREATANLTLQLWRKLEITTSSLPTGLAGFTYLDADGKAPTLAAEGGKAPLVLSATGLPEGMSLDATHALVGRPTRAATYVVIARATDANGKYVEKSFALEIGGGSPILGGGTARTPPEGRPLTDTAVIYVQDDQFNPVPNAGVRLRRNGVEFSPVREQLTDASGRAVFTGLGLNGTTDSIDVTVNGRGLQNVSMLGVKSAMITVPVARWADPFPRDTPTVAWEPVTQKVLAGMGQHYVSNTTVIYGDLYELTDPATGQWTERVPLSLVTAPEPRSFPVFTAGKGVMVLFGGNTQNGIYPGDVWHYDPVNRKWLQVSTSCSNCNGGTGPTGRVQAASARDAQGEVWVFGGMTTFGPTNELFAYDSNLRVWTQFSPQSSVQPRSGAQMEVLNGNLLLCGGNTASGQALSDCWIRPASPNQAAWQPTASLPYASSYFSLATDTSAGRVYLMITPPSGSNEFWWWSTSTGQWTQVALGATDPQPWFTYGSKLIYDAAHQELLCVDSQGDLWAWNGTKWAQRAQSFPYPSSIGISLPPEPNPQLYFTSAWDTRTGWGRMNQSTFTTYTQFMGVPPGSANTFQASAIELNSSTQAPMATWSDGGQFGYSVSWTPVTSGQVHTRDGTVTPPAGWSSPSYGGYVVNDRPGLPWVDVSGGMSVHTGSSKALYLPSDFGQRVVVTGLDLSSTVCEAAQASEPLPASGTFTVQLPHGLSGLSPGQSACSGASPSGKEISYNFTVPSGLQDVYFARMQRSPQGYDPDWTVFLPVKVGTNSFTLPQPSTLAPARSSLAGQKVTWAVWAHASGPNAAVPELSWDDAKLLAPKSDRLLIGLGANFVRAP